MFARMLASCLLGLVIVQTPAFAQTGFRDIVDHIHLAVPDQESASAWYHEHFGGETMTEGPDRLLFGDTRLLFQHNENAQPSLGSVIDHIGFSVTDIDATLKTLETDGGKIVAPVRDVEGLFKLAFVEDPWGTRIEIVQDPEKVGLHHIHLVASEPAAALAWYTQTFGGRVGKLKGRIDGIDYGGVWILVREGESVPSQGHSIDHIGFRPLNVDDTVAALEARDVKVTTEPRPLTLPSGVSMRLAFIEGPQGARIELVQR
jgi:catechol 2,3-dioxygenase-like lactoylglutathione lyase family enzyme